jgi:DhnA family fructose-bisphosphate aldolase class Ia
MAELDLERVGEIRARSPQAILDAASRRRRRPLLDESGRLMLIAADHPGRGALGAGRRELAMADRRDLLRRLVTALGRPGVDGLLATADVAEDLLLLGALEGKVVVGSMNRGGLKGASFELDDRFTGFDVPTIDKMGFEGGKMLCRIDLADAGSAATLEACGRAVGALAERRLMAMIEPFLARRVDGRVANDLSPDAVVTSVAISSALGPTSAYTWLKLPVVADMERVMATTTLPVLLLGGDPVEAPEETYGQWERALALPGVRGLVVGRSLLYPPGDDVEAAVDAAARLVRPGATAWA